MNFNMQLDNPIRLGMEEEHMDQKVNNFCNMIMSRYGYSLSYDDFMCEMKCAGFSNFEMRNFSKENLRKLDYFDLY
jgi:hypothetical protein